MVEQDEYKFRITAFPLKEIIFKSMNMNWVKNSDYEKMGQKMHS